MDPDHPAYDPVVDGEFADVIPSLYERMDYVVGYTLENMDPKTLLVVMSDHGFTSFRRSLHLNTWLKEEGYLAVKDPDIPGVAYSNVDWSQTRAYGLGFNGLYINLLGREKWGIVDPAYRQELMEEIAQKLLDLVDPATGKLAVAKVYFRETTYSDGGSRNIGPDLQVGYAKMTRCSFESALGEIGPEVFTDNTDAWSGDHLMDHEAVPGILLFNRPLRKPADKLQNLAAAILAEYGIDEFPTSATE
jgi:predicted AlkP superfamily phosphohydrolase/phosphomutase